MSDKKYEKPVLKSEKMFEKTVLSCIKGASMGRSGGCASAKSS